MTAIQVSRVQLFLLQAPIETPVRTSFAIMRNRPALLARVENNDGAAGWGEIWCNHPPLSGRLRMALAEEVIAPMLVGRNFSAPDLVYHDMMAALHILSIQTGEPGPYAQVVAGLEAAIWDMLARAARQSLVEFVGGAPSQSVRAYASGINPGEAVHRIRQAREAGFHDFKIKIGFDDDSDIEVIESVVDTLREGEGFMLDANQGWSIDHAMALAPRLLPFAPRWLEEPIPADSPIDAWKRLRDASSPPLAGGENLMDGAFQQAIESEAYAFIQPDVAKWGGIAGCLDVGHRTRSSGRTYCPHFLGAAPGLLASAHLLAAVGGEGLLEVDINENPLRDGLNTTPMRVVDGHFRLPDCDGIGFEPDLSVLNKYLVADCDVTSSSL